MRYCACREAFSRMGVSPPEAVGVVSMTGRKRCRPGV
jgi:hypothetical protein